VPEEVSADYTTCVHFLVTQEHEVKNRKPAPSTVSSYYHPDTKGSAVAAAAEVEVVEDGARGGGTGGGGGGGVTVDGRKHVPGAGAPSPPVTVAAGEGVPRPRLDVPVWISVVAAWLYSLVARANVFS
jgi:hypothetical protein